MNKINRAIYEIHHVDEMSERDIWINKIHSLPKLLVTLWYMVLVMSFSKYNITGLVGMSLYPIALMILGEIPIGKAIRRMRFVLLAILLLGIANPIFDREIIYTVGGFSVTSGMISMVTLFVKAGLAVFASFILVETTPIESICYAMRKLHIPKILVTMILLIYRYIILMLKETKRITQAYSIRAPRQKGIHYRVWGSLVGQMLLRSIDRAELVYESMTLRGFRGEFYLKGNITMGAGSVIYGVAMWILLLGLRVVPLFRLVGNLL